MNPLSVKRFSQALMLRAKTDKADSRPLKQYGEQFHPGSRKPKAAIRVEMQQLLRVLEQCEKHQVVWRNRPEAVSYSVVRNRYAISKVEASPKQVAKDIEEVEQQRHRLAGEREKTVYERLLTIPDIGRKTASTLLALLVPEVTIRGHRPK